MSRDSEPSLLPKGDRLEYAVASVFQGQSYLVRRGVPLRYGPQGQDATDIDVLGVRFTPPFQAHRIICDCKEKQRSKPYERIFWAKGLASFVKAVETYVALPKSNLEITTFAKSGGVRVLTQALVQDSLDKLCGTTNGVGYGLANGSFAEPLQRRLATLLKKEREAAKIYFDVRSLYLVEDPYVSLNICMAHLVTATSMLKATSTLNNDLFELWRVITADLIVLVSLLLVYIAADTVVLSKTDRSRHIIQKLTYGDISPDKAEDIFQISQELAHEATKALVPGTNPTSLLPFSLGRIEPPSYADGTVGLVERAINSPSLYYELPQLIDFLLFEQALQGKPFSDADYRKRFPTLEPDERLKVARNIFHFLKDFGGLDLKIFWPAQENNLPRVNHVA